MLRPPRRFPPALLALACALLASCASYPARTERALDDLRGGRFEAAATALEDTPGFLGPAEAGAVRLAGGDWSGAQADLLEAAEVVEQLDDEGLLEPAAVIEDLGALLLNERVNAYRGEGFERVQVHALLALAFLAQGRLESVGVEVRRANQLLENEQELYETEYAAGGLGHFLSALAYELRGDLDDALIDYRRMDSKGLAPSLVGPELLRLARRLSREDLLPDLERRHGGVAPVPPDHARVILIAGVGLAPQKYEASLAVPTAAGVVAIAVPGYRRRPQPVRGLELELAEVDVEVRSVVVEDLAQIAERNLDDRLGLLALRSGVRAASRTVVAKQLRDSDQHLAALAVDMFSLFAERADLRSWSTLPDSWQVAQAWVPPGVHTLRLDALGGQSADLGTYELVPGEALIVFARTIDRSLFAHVLGGAALEPGSDATAVEP